MIAQNIIKYFGNLPVQNSLKAKVSYANNTSYPITIWDLRLIELVIENVYYLALSIRATSVIEMNDYYSRFSKEFFSPVDLPSIDFVENVGSDGYLVPEKKGCVGYFSGRVFSDVTFHNIDGNVSTIYEFVVREPLDVY